MAWKEQQKRGGSVVLASYSNYETQFDLKHISSDVSIPPLQEESIKLVARSSADKWKMSENLGMACTADVSTQCSVFYPFLDFSGGLFGMFSQYIWQNRYRKTLLLQSPGFLPLLFINWGLILIQEKFLTKHKLSIKSKTVYTLHVFTEQPEEVLSVLTGKIQWPSVPKDFKSYMQLVVQTKKMRMEV